MNTDTLKLDTPPQEDRMAIAELGVATEVIRDYSGNFQWDAPIYDFKMRRIWD